MKTLKILILILLPIFSFSQTTGKILRNQSIKIDAIAEDTVWYIEISNMNTCRSKIDVILRGKLLEDTTTIEQYEAVALFLKSPFEIKTRNATTCDKGTTDWITFSSTMDALNLKVSKLQQSISYDSNCDIQPQHLPVKIPTKQNTTTNPPSGNNTRSKSL